MLITAFCVVAFLVGCGGKPAPLNNAAAEKVATAMMKTSQGKDTRKDFKARREALVQAFEECGYSLPKTLQLIAKNPMEAQRHGTWTGFMLAFVSDLNDKQIEDTFTKEEAKGFIELKKAMSSF
jgi:hypothetical protein